MKELIIHPRKLERTLIEHALSKGLKSFYCNPENIPEDLRAIIKIYSEEEGGDVKVVHKLSQVEEGTVLRIKVKSPGDVEKVLAAAKAGAEAIIVETGDWRIIPLENLVADLQPLGARLLAIASNPNEVETLLGVLELGVDGVVLEAEGVGDIDLAFEALAAPRKLRLDVAEVTEVKDVGMGERACIDTVAILGTGEGMLVGNTASIFLLIHNESIGSNFTSPRPFRVNAGAVHCYILMPDGSTRYLSELSTGDRVLVVSNSGKARVVAIGRVKIERRPLRLVKIRAGEVEGSATVQNAETIRFIRPDGSLVSVTELKPGDRILSHIAEAGARHFGRAVKEFILEK